MHHLRPSHGIRLRQAEKAVWQQGLLPGVETQAILQPPTNRTQPTPLKRRLRIRRAYVHMRQRPLRVDHGRRLLPEMRSPGTTILARAMGTSRVRSETALHVQPDLQAILCLQALGARLRDFLPTRACII